MYNEKGEFIFATLESENPVSCIAQGIEIQLRVSKYNYVYVIESKLTEPVSTGIFEIWRLYFQREAIFCLFSFIQKKLFA